MSSKITVIFTVLIVLLVLASGGLGYWASSLNEKLNTLSDDTQAFVADTTNQFSVTNDSIAGVGSELTFFKSDTADELSGIQSDIASLGSGLNNFKTLTNQQIGT